MTMKLTFTSAVLAVAVMVMATAPSSAQGRADGREGARERVRVREHVERRIERRERVREIARRMQFTETQKAQALAAARVVQPVAQAARVEVRKIVEDARAAHPGATRGELREVVGPQVKAVRERAMEQVLPQARAIVAGLTVEQRAKIDAALAKRGKTFDAEKAAKRVAWLLARPRAVEVLEARVKGDGPRTR